MNLNTHDLATEAARLRTDLHRDKCRRRRGRPM